MDSEYALYGSKESPEIHISTVSYSYESDVSLIFKPSDQLSLALSGFLRPEVRERHHFDFKTDPIKVLPIVGGDSSGWKHWRSRGADGNQESDTDWLDDYRKKMKSIADVSIPAAALPPSYEVLLDDSLLIELAFVPSLAVKRKIGQYGLRTYIENDEEGEVVQILRTLNAHVAIPERKLVKSSDLQAASDYLLEELEWSAGRPFGVTPIDKRMYITQPAVSDKRVF